MQLPESHTCGHGEAGHRERIGGPGGQPDRWIKGRARRQPARCAIAVFHKVEHAYIKKDIELYLNKELEKTKKDNEEFLENFIYSRNKTMSKRAVRIINENKTFIAVGAAHLYGENGMISLLKKEGLILRPLH